MVSRRRFIGDVAFLSASGLTLAQKAVAEKWMFSSADKPVQPPLLPSSVGGPVEFRHRFAPSGGMLADVEKPLREEICLNGSWRFQPVGVPRDYKRGTGTPPELPLPVESQWESTPVKVPSPWNVNTWGNGRDCGEGTRQPYVADSVYFPSYPPKWDGIEMGWLERSFNIPSTWRQRRIILHFEAVAGEVQVLVNGRQAGKHFDSFLPFDLDVTDLVTTDHANTVTVGIRKSNLLNIITPNYPSSQQRTYPNGSNMDGLVGIWNDVYLWALPTLRVDTVFVQPRVSEGLLKIDMMLRNDTDVVQHATVGGEVRPWHNLAGTDVISAPEPSGKLGAPVFRVRPVAATVPAHGTVQVALEFAVKEQLKTWSPDSPNLYGLVLTLFEPDKKPVDVKYTRFGWRQFQIKGRKLLLNGEPLKLWGDFGHPFGAFVCSRRYVWQDYTMIKAMGGNMVRPHANIMPRFWLDMADEMGLCVLDETSIFGSSISLNLKEPITWQRLRQHVDGLVLRDRNHASVFGWGVANEMFALFLHTDDADKAQGYALLKQLAERPKVLDPTRQWISVDGDQDLDGTLSVWSKHMGIGLPDALPNLDKPRMIGEHGGTYYAAPPRLRSINGDRAYQSYRGRNEALAYDLYRMVTQCARPELSAFSESEIVWFGIEQLPFGYGASSRPPNKTDGVFFPSFVENVAGMQIERLPPYVTGLNPGFDPSLPAFKPLPLYEAMKAAIDPRGPQASPWSSFPSSSKSPKTKRSDPIQKVAFLGDRGGALFVSLTALGVPLNAPPKLSDAAILVIDAETVTDMQTLNAEGEIETILNAGGLVWIMISDKGVGLNNLTTVLGAGISVTSRQATSLDPSAKNSAVEGFSLSEMYFAEEVGERRIQKAGLQGPFVDKGRVLLSASNTDWTLFDRQPESAKCGSMLIYEQLQKPSGAALVEMLRSNGRMWVSTLNAAPSTPAFISFWTQLWGDIGVRVTKPSSTTQQKKNEEHDLLLDGPK